MIRNVFGSWRVFYIVPYIASYTFGLLVTKLVKKFVNIFCVLVIKQTKLLGRTRFRIIANISNHLFLTLFSHSYHSPKLMVRSVPFSLLGRRPRDWRPSRLSIPGVNLPAWLYLPVPRTLILIIVNGGYVMTDGIFVVVLILFFSLLESFCDSA